MAFGLGYVLGGLGQGLLLGPPSEAPIPAAGPGVWVGGVPISTVERRDNPSLGTVPFWRKFWEGHLVPGPLPLHPPAHSLEWWER